MKKKLSNVTRWFILPLLVGFFGTNLEAQVMTNRTPDKAKIQPDTKSNPSPSPGLGASIIADPVVSPPGTTPPSIPEPQATLAYYVMLSGAKRVLVSDTQGRTDDLFKAGWRQQIHWATYHFVGQDTVYIIVPVRETYWITFESTDPVMTLEVVKGRGTVAPEEAIRYNDLVLEKRRARFQLSSAGVGPVQLDSNHDGRFESILEPSAHVRGVAARDTRGPEIKFEVLERDATSILVAIKAIDEETGVKNVFYSTDNKYDYPYDTPVRVKLNQSTFIVGVADDNAGNRSVVVYEFDKRPAN